jgi:hypothetical protein
MPLNLKFHMVKRIVLRGTKLNLVSRRPVLHFMKHIHSSAPLHMSDRIKMLHSVARHTAGTDVLCYALHFHLWCIEKEYNRGKSSFEFSWWKYLRHISFWKLHLGISSTAPLPVHLQLGQSDGDPCLTLWPTSINYKERQASEATASSLMSVL